MATSQQKAFCVLRFDKYESIITVQRDFRWEYRINPPTPPTVRRWHQQFLETGCLCKGKSPGHPRVSVEIIDNVRTSFVRSPQKSVRRASREIGVLRSRIWKILRKQLRMKPYKNNKRCQLPSEERLDEITHTSNFTVLFYLNLFEKYTLLKSENSFVDALYCKIINDIRNSDKCSGDEIYYFSNRL